LTFDRGGNSRGAIHAAENRRAIHEKSFDQKRCAGGSRVCRLGAGGRYERPPVYKAPPPVVAPSWTGFYVGAGVGLRASRADATTTSEAVNGSLVDLTGNATTLPMDGTAFRASPYIGFNWQFAPQWVAGIEGDAGFARQTTRLAGFAFSPAFGSSIDSVDGLAVKTTWDASLRGRFGFLLTPATMAYATAGVAWQHYEVTSTCAGPLFCAGPGFAFAPAVVTNSATKAGWTVGGGLETALWSHWIARAEYRYADFGTAPFTIARTVTGGNFSSVVDNFDVTMRTHTVTFGLAYKFN
jgi:outer membrane immunogenic protein